MDINSPLAQKMIQIKRMKPQIIKMEKHVNKNLIPKVTELSKHKIRFITAPLFGQPMDPAL